MTEYLFRPEVVRVALVVGVVVSVLFYERVQLTTGGAVVPAYLAISLPAPLHVLSTLLAGFGAYLLVSVVLSRRLIVYGRRKFELEVLAGLVLVALLSSAAALLDDVDPALAGVAALGYLVPGVIAHDMSRQRPGRTLFAVAVTTVVLGAVVYLYASLLAISPLRDEPLDDLAALTAYPPELTLPAAFASVAVGMLVFSRLGLRSGGFISGAYLAMVAPRWGDIVFALAAAVVTWALVVHVIMPRLLVFGRRKLSTMVLVGALVAWTGEVLVATLTAGDHVPWRGLPIMALMVPALLANDAQRQGWERTLWGAGLTTVGVLGLVWLSAGVARLLGWL
ncbi:poly-gamma-glutamate biosynthesis protein PgsC/CapC [Aquipuribacter nitratireducens]|uniref:Poly-gamma-glutamate biosynthesis protein PgsC/CapC n=1 Tax=Aquipuribacter nitratireducens TaxID=650104 RepID=A0ABW0GNY8_9MICO